MDRDNSKKQQQPTKQQQKQQKEQQQPLKKSSTKKREMARQKLEQQMERESQVLQGAFACGVVASVLFLISFSTEYWVYVTLGKAEPKEDAERGGKYLKTGHYHGLWRFCRNELWPSEGNETVPSVYCRRMTFDVLPNIKPERIEVETKMADFRRSTVAVGVIALVLSIMAHCFTWYSLNQMRYMFKRLAGCLHLITGASCWVVSEVFRQSMMYEERSMKEHVKEFSEIKLGWSYYLVWVSLVAFVLPGLALLYYSRKRKGGKARSMREADENEPVHLGRI